MTEKKISLLQLVEEKKNQVSLSESERLDLQNHFNEAKKNRLNKFTEKWNLGGLINDIYEVYRASAEQGKEWDTKIGLRIKVSNLNGSRKTLGDIGGTYGTDFNQEGMGLLNASGADDLEVTITSPWFGLTPLGGGVRRKMTLFEENSNLAILVGNNQNPTLFDGEELRDNPESFIKKITNFVATTIATGNDRENGKIRTLNQYFR